MSIVQNNASAEMGAFDQQDEQIVRYLGLNPSSPADRAMVAVCRAYDFDPVLKHVVVIPKGGVYITRDGLLHVAHRSGQLDGIVVDQDPKLVDGEWIAKVSVYRKDMRHPFTYPGRYSATGSNRQYAQEMALKAAEAHALRRAFDVTGLPTIDEQRPEPAASESSSSVDRMRAALNPSPAPGVPAPQTTDPEAPPVSQDAERAGEALLDPTSALAIAMYARLREHGIDKPGANALYADVTGRAVESSKELTEGEAREVLRALDEPVQAELVEDPS